MEGGRGCFVRDEVCSFLETESERAERAETAVRAHPSPERALGKLFRRKSPASLVGFVRELICVSRACVSEDDV